MTQLKLLNGLELMSATRLDKFPGWAVGPDEYLTDDVS